MNQGYKASMDEGKSPDLTTQGNPTRVQIQEKMGNPNPSGWSGLQYAGYKGAPDAKVLPGGMTFMGGKGTK